MRITKMELSEIGPFKHAQIDFPEKPKADMAEIHILTGPNGSGKSTILYALALSFGDPKPALQRMWGDGRLQIGVVTNENAYDIPISEHYFLNDSCAKNYLNFFDTPNEKRDEAKDEGILSNFFSTLFSSSAKHNAFMTQLIFGYAGKRTGEYESVNDLTMHRQRLSGKHIFLSTQANTKIFIQWLTNKMAMAAIEKDRDPVAAQHHTETLSRNEEVLSQCLGKPVSFELFTHPSISLKMVVDGQYLDLNILPDGLKSILGWLGDLLMRLDRLNPDPHADSLAQPFILLLDEIDIHLHPSWQRRLLPVVQKLFPNAQIFCSTHSPFVVNSVDGAWIHALEMEGAFAKPKSPELSQEGRSYATVLSQIFDTPQRFGPDVERQIADFYALRGKLMQGDLDQFDAFKTMADSLAEISTEVRNIVIPEYRQIAKALKREPAS